MLTHQLFHVKVLLKRLSILLLLYAMCRVLFYLFNQDIFPDISFGSFLLIMWYGLRYDIAAIIVVNFLFILLHIVPNPWRERKKYQRILKILFLVFNGIALLLESADFVYFRYGLKRTTTHKLGLVNDTNVLPQVFKDLWYVILIVIALLFFIEYLYRKTQFNPKQIKESPRHMPHHMQLGASILFIVIILIGSRGGLQAGTLSPSSASDYTGDKDLSQLIMNTPFTIIYAFENRRLKEPNYFNNSNDLTAHFNIYRENEQHYASPNKKKNICLIVLESFSKEYIGYFNHGKGSTPFLDSLLSNGQCFTNAYSNGKSSNQGITAITSSIPVLMEEPFISSIYQHNNFNGIGTTLKPLGYSSYFFHGASNTSMGFDKFMQRAGFDGYFGRNEYANEKDYDGNWGIFDEPFLKWSVKKISEFKTPFYAELFTISSHYPFTIPKQYTNKFKKGVIPILEVISYTDYALQQFFEEAKKHSWYNNTLFILTADHAGPPLPFNEFYINQVGAHSTWMLFYTPDKQFTGVFDDVVQQTDILPTVLDYAGYRGKFVAFGNSIFDKTSERYTYNYHSGTYMILNRDFVLQYNGSKTIGLFNYKQDSLLRNNLMHSNPEMQLKLETKLKAIIQVHHQAMIKNKLTWTE